MRLPSKKVLFVASALRQTQDQLRLWDESRQKYKPPKVYKLILLTTIE
jgi:hypothetical protein